jgi:hypothetical protein
MSRRSEERTRFLGDIITGAVEGGTGYWAKVSQYQWQDSDGSIRVVVGQRVGDGPRAALHPLTDEQTFSPDAVVVDVETVATGLNRILVEPTCRLRADLRRTISEASRENDGGLIDAEGADVIVQAGLFGQVIYG